MIFSRNNMALSLLSILIFTAMQATGEGESGSAGTTQVEIVSTLDGVPQQAIYYSPKADMPAPLVVCLHSWSGDYAQEDPLVEKSAAAGWNYIHPDFRGPNNNQDACLSDKVIADIDDAIQFALDNGPVDRNAVFIVGASGGGHATLGIYLRTRHKVRMFLSWVPISDLAAWYWESKSRANKYAEDIVHCTSPAGVFSEADAWKRSPLHWPVPPDISGRLEIYAGINDGYTGSVPVSHSLFFFNKIADHFGGTDARVPDTDIIRLLARGVSPDPALEAIEGRPVLYRKEIPQVAVTIFEGGHELLADYCFSRMQEELKKNTP